jgi:hypothetical protein
VKRAGEGQASLGKRAGAYESGRGKARGRIKRANPLRGSVESENEGQPSSGSRSEGQLRCRTKVSNSSENSMSRPLSGLLPTTPSRKTRQNLRFF